MQTLYRKYRPQDFNEVFGQEAIVKVLKLQIKDNKIGHAYIFSGPRGTGKTSLARLVAKAVNCSSIKNGNPCKRCNSCLAIERGKFMDLIEIDAASNRGIDEIRRLRERVNFSPTEGKYKVYIIDEVHMLTKDAFNALLKTLEEPPKHVIFILATTEPHKIPSTILSRCQRFNFVLAEDAILLKRLQYICKKERVGFSDDALIAIVKNAGGSFRDSESILEKVLGAMGVQNDKKIDLADVKEILGLAADKEVIKFVDKLLEKNASGSLKVFNKIFSSGVNLFQFIRQSLEYLRDLMIKKVSKNEGKFLISDLIKVITEFTEAENKMKYTQVRRLPIEVAIVKICSDVDLDNEKGLDKEVSSRQRGGNKRKISGLVTNAISGIPKKIKNSLNDKKVDIKIEDIKEKWEKLIKDIKPYNHHLSAFFKKARPIRLTGSNLVVSVPFKFHKQRIEDMKAQRVFNKISKDLFGIKLCCVCEVTNKTGESGDSDVELKGNNKVILEVLGDILD